jgi:hypothetical protein
MSSPPPTTTFISRGRLNGVLRQGALGRRQANRGGTPSANGSAELDTQAYEALYYRARLILGDSLPRPAR